MAAVRSMLTKDQSAQVRLVAYLHEYAMRNMAVDEVGKITLSERPVPGWDAVADGIRRELDHDC